MWSASENIKSTPIKPGRLYPVGTRWYRYQPKLERDFRKRVRQYDSITTMRPYGNKSVEELRLEDLTGEPSSSYFHGSPLLPTYDSPKHLPSHVNFWELAPDDVGMYTLSFVSIDQLFKMKRVTKSGNFSKCLALAIMSFPNVDLWGNGFDAYADRRAQARLKYCLKPRNLRCDMQLAGTGELLTRVCGTLSSLDIVVFACDPALPTDVIFNGLKSLQIELDKSVKMFCATQVPNLTELTLTGYSEHLSNWISTELPKLKTLKSLSLPEHDIMHKLEPPPCLAHLAMRLAFSEQWEEGHIKRLPGKFSRLESFDLCIAKTNLRASASIASFLKRLPPLKTVGFDDRFSSRTERPALRSSFMHVLNSSRDTLQKWRHPHNMFERMCDVDIVFPHLTDIDIGSCCEDGICEMLVRFAPNLTSLTVGSIFFDWDALKCFNLKEIHFKQEVGFFERSDDNLKEIAAKLADATIFPELAFISFGNSDCLQMERQTIRNVRKDCVVCPSSYSPSCKYG